MKHTIHLLAALLLGFFLLVPVVAQAQRFTADDSQPPSTTPVWSQGIRSLGSIQDMATGKDGEVYIAGREMFARYNQDGEQIWNRQAALNAWQRFDYIKTYLIVAGTDRIYTSEGPPPIAGFSPRTVPGNAIGIHTLGGETLRVIPVGYNENYSGVHYHFPEAGWILSMGLDEAGNIYAVGRYNKDLAFGSDSLAPSFGLDGYDVFLASYTSEGTPRWGRRIKGDSLAARRDYCAFDNQGLYVFTVDRHGNTYFADCFGEGAVFGEGQPGEVTFTEDARALASYDAAGNLRWVRTLSDLGIQEEAYHRRDRLHPEQSPYILDMTVDAEGNFFASWFTHAWQNGDSLKPVMVGDAALVDPGGDGVFFTKHNPDGDILWVRQLAGEGNDHICDLATDAQGDIYIGGFINSPVINIGETQVVKSGDEHNGFVARYDKEGNLRWVTSGAGENYYYAILGVTVSSVGDLYITGNTFPYQYGCGRYAPPSGYDVLAKYAASTITSSEAAAELPTAAALTSNYPNPFTNRTTIEYALPASGPVRLAVYDALGREVATLVDGVRQAGAHVAVFDGSSLPSGVYLYRLEAAGQAKTGMMTLRK